MSNLNLPWHSLRLCLFVPLLERPTLTMLKSPFRSLSFLLSGLKKPASLSCYSQDLLPNFSLSMCRSFHHFMFNPRLQLFVVGPWCGSVGDSWNQLHPGWDSPNCASQRVSCSSAHLFSIHVLHDIHDWIPHLHLYPSQFRLPRRKIPFTPFWPKKKEDGIDHACFLSL